MNDVSLEAAHRAGFHSKGVAYFNCALCNAEVGEAAHQRELQDLREQLEAAHADARDGAEVRKLFADWADVGVERGSLATVVMSTIKHLKQQRDDAHLVNPFWKRAEAAEQLLKRVQAELKYSDEERELLKEALNKTIEQGNAEHARVKALLAELHNLLADVEKLKQAALPPERKS